MKIWNVSHLSLVALAILCTVPASQAQNANDAGKDKKEESKVATVEVTPAQASASIGEKVQFKAIGKDANGQVQPDPVKTWFAAPFDSVGADNNGVASFFHPGEMTIGAVIGGKTGYAHVSVAKPHAARIELAAAPALIAGANHRLTAIARNADGDPRTDVALAWSSENPAIASVDASGLVHATKPGKAKIRVGGDGASAEVSVTVLANSIARLSVSPTLANAKTGDVVHFSATAADPHGKPIKTEVGWAVQASGAEIASDGGFVAERPGTYTIQASIGRLSSVASVVVTPRDIGREVEVVAHMMPKDQQFAEEWIWDHCVYLSTIADKVYPYDITDPAHPVEADPLKVDARLVNDVSVTADGKIGVLTREGASNRKNGIVFFDASDPMHPKVISEYTATVTGGVHSAYINSHYVYLTDDATGSLRIIDFADVKNPKEVARWEVEGSGHVEIPTPDGMEIVGRYLHDVQVIDGLAYLAYWRDGLVILDVGNGIKGGSPEHPQLVSNYRFDYVQLYGPGWLAGAHAVYRYKNYVFIGDEVFPAMFKIASKNRIPVRGIAHVMDVSDLAHPREVATYSVPESGAHNIWVFDDVLYMGYYNGGGRVLDVSGELRGELFNQGREIARIWTGDPQGFRPNLPFAWGAYPYQGNIYVNDVHSGLWIVRLGKHKQNTLTTETPH